MRLLKFNEAYRDRPMTEEDLEVVEDCLYGLIETWGLKTKYIPKENPTPYSTTQIREYGFEDDNRFTGDYYMSLDNRHMGSINLSIRMPHLKGDDLKKFLNGLNIFYRRLESQGMSEYSGRNTGKRSWTYIYPDRVRYLAKISQTAVREWDIHIRWSPYKKWKESELQNIKPFNESVEEKPYYKITTEEWQGLIGIEDGNYGANMVPLTQREKDDITSYYNQFYDPDFPLIWYRNEGDNEFLSKYSLTYMKHVHFVIVRPDGNYFFTKTDDDWFGVFYLPKRGVGTSFSRLAKTWKCDQILGVKKFIFDIQYYKVEGF
jgi:hypothetical protein